jgi:hypothetical protein
MTDYDRRDNSGILRIRTNGQWAAFELGDFLNDITMVYNVITISNSETRLSSFKKMLNIMSSSVDFYKLPTNALAQLLQHFYVGEEGILMIPKIRMGSPGVLELRGEKRSFDTLSELLQFALNLPNDDAEGCIKYLTDGAGKKFIENFGEIGYTLSRVICEKVSLVKKLHSEQKLEYVESA